MYGLTIFSGGTGSDRFRRAAALAADADRAGFDAVWTGELYNRSATVPMAVLAGATERVRNGSDIASGRPKHVTSTSCPTAGSSSGSATGRRG